MSTINYTSFTPDNLQTEAMRFFFKQLRHQGKSNLFAFVGAILHTCDERFRQLCQTKQEDIAIWEQTRGQSRMANTGGLDYEEAMVAESGKEFVIDRFKHFVLMTKQAQKARKKKNY